MTDKTINHKFISSKITRKNPTDFPWDLSLVFLPLSMFLLFLALFLLNFLCLLIGKDQSHWWAAIFSQIWPHQFKIYSTYIHRDKTFVEPLPFASSRPFLLIQGLLFSRSKRSLSNGFLRYRWSYRDGNTDVANSSLVNNFLRIFLAKSPGSRPLILSKFSPL